MTKKGGKVKQEPYIQSFDEALIGVFRSTFEGKFLYVNQAFADILKYPSPRELMDSVKDIEKDMFVEKGIRQKLLEGIETRGKLTNYEIQYYCKDRSVITALLNMGIKQGGEDQPPYLEGFINDITYIKEKEKSLTESEERWNFALEGSAYGVWDWDVETGVFYLSKQYNALRGSGEKGYTCSYDQWMAFIHEGDRDRVIEKLDKHMNGETSMYTEEYRLRQKSGGLLWVQERAKATKRDEKGKALRIVGTQRDITEEKERREALLYQKKSFESLFDNSPEAITYFDEKECIIAVNPGFTKLFGYTMEEVRGRRVNDVLDPHNELDSYLMFDQFTERDFTFKDTVRYDKYGKPINVLAKGVPIVMKEKMVAGYAIYTDISFMKHAEREMKKQKKILEYHFKYSPDAVIHIDLNHRILQTNRKFTELFGYTMEEALGETIDDLIAPERYREEALGINDLALNNRKIEVDTVRKSKEGTLIDVCVRGGPTIVDGNIIGYHGIYTDIRERKEAEAKIRYLSYYDKLTGLYNRAFFEEKLKGLNRRESPPLSVIVGDVNGLKLTNDVFGHSKGDQLLIKTAEVLRQACRKEDILCRWGGDEFAILLPNTEKEQVDKVCRRVYSLCQESSGDPINISISLGYATKEKPSESISAVIKKAEEQMYRNKLLETKSTRSHIIDSLQKSMYERSHETEEHAMRMKDMSIALGRAMRLENHKLNELGLLAILHDIGKMAIPDAILQKPGKLTEEEWEKMKTHSEIGYRIAETSPGLMHISKYILAHHERWDGEGYPYGLKGEEIPILSRVISVVDVYDVMTHARVYKEAVSHQEAIEEIKRCSGTQFDPEVAGKFVELFG